MNKKIISLLVAGSALIAGCDQQMGTTATTTVAAPVIKKEDAIASVNGQYISKATLAELEKEIAEKAHGQSFPKEKLIEELVQRELLIQDAVKKQLDKTPDMQKQLDVARNSLLTQADLQDFVKKNPVTDAEIKAEYDSKVGGTNATEYKARHILVKTEDEAKKLIAALDKGGDFAKLANKNSVDAKESQNGGDLGWFNPSQMVAPFSEAVAKLEKGKYSKVPVKTQFGYHIILREDSRAQTPPPLDSVKDQLTPFLQRQKTQKMLEGLRKQAKVEILVPVVDEKPKAAIPPAVAPTPDAANPAATPAPGAAPAAAVEPPATIEAAPVTEKPAQPAAVVPTPVPAPAPAAK
ncbi:peptidylprolyl isomerase [Crenothrix sp.]|uniref:peptidylprolyl isomerase n=1 Tax=Crenothrix sp. TaxID=3100433 RepID=UPI00374D2B82